MTVYYLLLISGQSLGQNWKYLLKYLEKIIFEYTGLEGFVTSKPAYARSAVASPFPAWSPGEAREAPEVFGRP